MRLDETQLYEHSVDQRRHGRHRLFADCGEVEPRRFQVSARGRGFGYSRNRDTLPSLSTVACRGRVDLVSQHRKRAIQIPRRRIRPSGTLRQ